MRSAGGRPVAVVNGAPAVVLDAATCRFLELNAGLDTLAVMARATAPEVAAQLGEIRLVAHLVSGAGQAFRREAAEMVSAAGHSVAPTVVEGSASSRVISVREAAHRLGRTSRSVTRYIERDVLKAEKVGTAWAIDPQSVERLRVELEKGGTA